jgi:hypothetical protein
MLVVVDGAGKDHRKEIDIFKLSFLHPVPSSNEIIKSLCNVSCMCFIMVRYRVIPRLNLINKSKPHVQVNVHL